MRSNKHKKKSKSIGIPETAGRQQQKQQQLNIKKDWYEDRSSQFSKNVGKQRELLVKQEQEKKQQLGDKAEQMTKETKDAILDAKFDFATLSGCLSDIRKGFWNVDRINAYYKNKIRLTHSHFY